MKLVIQGKNIDITDSLRDYVDQKVKKAVSHFQNLTTEVDVHLSIEKNPRITSSQAAEVTIYANGTVIRAHETSESMYASIDLVADKIARQLRKYKEKRFTKKAATSAKDAPVPVMPIADIDTDREPELPSDVVRMKYFAMAPMAVEEALEQLQLVDHDFYMFLNADSGEINVIYERNHGGYGLIQPRKTGEEGLDRMIELSRAS